MRRADIADLWSGRGPVSTLLLPLSWLFRSLVALRRAAYRLGLLRRHRLPVPVVVVGNLTVGGTGKTPLVVWLARHLRESGWQPGIVARGYGGQARSWPQRVRPDSDPIAVGDEPVLVAAETQCPVAVGPDRVAAARALLANDECDILISDDGLQHYALERDLEILVLDGERRFGNGRLLPAGPLREPLSRRHTVDLVIATGGGLRGEHALQLGNPRVRPLRGDPAQAVPLSDWHARRVHAVAGIGNPQRFFALLEAAGLVISPHPFPDHHVFRAGDLVFDEPLPILMTAKDAVKCRRLGIEHCWVLDVEAQPDRSFVYRVDTLLAELNNGPEAA